VVLHAAARTPESGRVLNAKAIPMVAAVGLQALILLGAVWIGVRRPVAREEAVFAAVVGPAQQRPADPQQRQQRRELENLAREVRRMDALVTDSLLSDWSVPDVAPEGMDALMQSAPDVADAQMRFSADVGAEVPMPDLPEFSFFGIEERAEKLVICFDISQSVKNKVEQVGMSMERIREETRRLIAGLNANTQVGLIQFSRNYDAFAQRMVAGTRRNREALDGWLGSRFRVDGLSGRGWTGGQPNGIEAVLRAAFAMDEAPDLVVILSDGDFQRTPEGGGSQDVSWREIGAELDRLQAGLVRPAKIHFIGVAMTDQHRREAARCMEAYGGVLRLLE